MAPTAATAPPTVTEDSGLPTAAIVFISIGAYMIIFTLVVLIRLCLLKRGLFVCPDWMNEMCCTTCICVTRIAELCDFNVPTKHTCLDTCCPSKQKCDETFCCCMNEIPGGSLCDDCSGPECECGDCNCACNCQLPECNSINCICFEIQLKQPVVPPIHQGMPGSIQGPQGYYGQYPRQTVTNPAEHINYGVSHSNPQA